MILFAVGVLVGAWRLATRPDAGMAVVQPDRAPRDDDDGPLTADALVAYPLPMGFGYRKVDVDLLLDRVARQLPRAAGATGADRPAWDPDDPAPDPDPESDAARVSLSKEDDRG